MRKRILITVLTAVILIAGSSFKSDFFEIAKQIEIFTTLFKELNMNYVDETNPAELMDTAIKNMLEDLDPYTVYMNEQDVEAYKIKNAGEYSGIGALARSYEDKLLIVEPYKDYPADKAGLKAGDEIIKIGDINVADVKDDAGELLKGAVATKIPVTFRRQGKVQSITITLEEIEVDAVPYYGKVNDKTGYIVLSRFNRKASSQTKEALETLKSQGIENLILDLRGNPGGLLLEAIRVTNLFVPKGEPIVTTKSKVKKFNKTYATRNDPVDTQIPLVVLVDERSASASEIVSGALQDLDRAVIAGTQSYGKGLVQRPLKLTYGTQLKVTISRYHTPSGRCIQAINYKDRDEEGKAIKKTTYNTFKTRNGRTVYDGGGIMPDIEITALKHSELTKALAAKYIIFDYATQYYYKNNIATINDFSFQSQDFEDFKRFVSENNTAFDTAVEKSLKAVAKNTDFDALSTTVKKEYESLLKNIQQEKQNALDTHSEKLIKELEDEIIKRYFYRDGLYNYYLQHDKAILTATKILTDTAKYKRILTS
ncbi:MAG: S41 family peptidase [Bacteroidota bacterium]